MSQTSNNTVRNLTHEDHLKWWLEEPLTGKRTLFKTRESLAERFRFESGEPSRPVLSWYEELKNALRLSIDSHGSTFNVFYSGGFDSEILVRTLVELGANVVAHTIKFQDGENANETQHTDGVCDALGIKQVIWLHDPKRYVREEKYLELGVKYSCTQLAYITVLEFVRRVQDLPTFMGGEIYVQLRQRSSMDVKSGTEWVYVYREDEDGMTYRYAMDTGHTLINEAFSYTPELVHAWTHCRSVQQIVQGHVPGKLSLISSKPKIFEEIYPYPTAARRKLHGYENLYYTHLIARNKLKDIVIPGETYTEPVADQTNYEEVLNSNPIAG